MKCSELPCWAIQTNDVFLSTSNVLGKRALCDITVHEGVQIYLHRENIPRLFDRLRALNVSWVKVQVSWKLHQPYPDHYSDELFGELDRLVHTAEASDIAVLLSVSKAPEWSRPTTEMDGTPGDYTLYPALHGDHCQALSRQRCRL